MRHLKGSGVTLAHLPEAEPVALRELRLEGPDGPVRVPYLLFRTRYGYHATPGDWGRMTVAERAWLVWHEDLLNRALLADVETVAAEARRAGRDVAAAGGFGVGRNLPRNGHLPEGAGGMSAVDLVGGGGRGMGGTDRPEREEGGLGLDTGGGRERPAAPGDVPEGAPVPETRLIEAETPADLTVSSLARAIDELADRPDVRRPFQLIVHRYAMHLAQHFAFRLFGLFWRGQVEVVPDEAQADEGEWALESGGWRYHNPGR